MVDLNHLKLETHSGHTSVRLPQVDKAPFNVASPCDEGELRDDQRRGKLQTRWMNVNRDVTQSLFGFRRPSAATDDTPDNCCGGGGGEEGCTG